MATAKELEGEEGLEPSPPEAVRKVRRGLPARSSPLGARSAAPALRAPPAAARRPQVLIILHGKRAGDPAFEQAVKEIKAAGHTVRSRLAAWPLLPRSLPGVQLTRPSPAAARRSRCA
jgi:hypothetical protein